MELRSINPWSGETLNTYSILSSQEIETKLQNAHKTFLAWRQTTLSHRAELMNRLANVLEEKKQELGELITKEMGKPISQAISEIEKCAWVCRYYAEKAPEFLADRQIETDASKSFIRMNPLGVVLAVMPWNYPFWQYFRFAAPNFMAGNVGVLKHASNVSGCALSIEKLFIEAGFPEGVSQTLLIKSDQVKSVIENEVVKAVTLTGSEGAGSAVAQQAGKEIKKTVLELGGTNAVIVFDDAKLDDYMSTMVQARFQNTGQSCIAGKRFLIQSGIYDDFLQKFKEQVSQLKSGNPTDENTFIGSMATEKLAKELETQMNQSLSEGATLTLGGNRDKAYFEPTILENVSKDMTVFKEETFGPLAAITKFNTEEEATLLSNATNLGLGVSLFTENEQRVVRMIDLLEEGAVFVNELVKSDPRLPFGGINKSGYGRELSEAGCLEFVNWKTVYIK